MVRLMFMLNSETIVLVLMCSRNRSMAGEKLNCHFADMAGACKAVVINIKRTHIIAILANRSRAKN